MINNSIIKFIRELTKKDKKNLSQKALKVSEETGELAKCVLPFDNAPGTLHRFTDKNKVLEEVSDVILCAISVAYQIGCTDDQVEEMIYSKAVQWQGILQKETKVDPDKIPYEIHITIKNSGDDEFIEDFKRICKIVGVKPLVLDLEKDGESVMKDAQTSSNFFGNNRQAFLECNRIAIAMEDAGFEVVRRKIETVPWHPAAPSDDHHKKDMPKDCYFEAHIGCIITKEEKHQLQFISDAYGAHLSRNFFKKLEDGKFVNMVTLRAYEGTFEKFEEKLEQLKEDLRINNVDFDKVITEFSIYDTKVSHDSSWLLGKEKKELV